MTLQKFIDKYLGKQVEYHSYGGPDTHYQCVDLANQYIVEVLGLTPVIGAHAKDFKDRFNKDQFEWIVNTPEAIIQEGDIPVWNGRVGGGAGHIAVATKKGTINNFTSLDQNWSQKQRVTLEKHTYSNIYGWLRPRGSMSDPGKITIDQDLFEELVSKSSKYDAFKNAGWDNPEKVTQLIEGYKNDLKGEQNKKKAAEEALEARRKEDNKLRAEMAEIHQTVQDWNEIVKACKSDSDKASELEDLVIKYNKDKEAWSGSRIELEAEIARLKALLEQKDVITNLETRELLSELLRRLTRALDRSK